MTCTWRSLVTLVPAVICKVENVPHELGDWTKEISIHTVEGAAWFLAAYDKMLEERKKL